ncbi:hypothetical protein GIB67_017052 [Kingdonia uniflora]|uniref:R13L1/DRL21-like LRR repeat region domain-containing protein n=1 Tax=Kingdonia uniflora TaxID=39325 RepID=A0A7J7NC61_9MAGN|nr:hypothetical protein GIB67_017052 [Kingdonia uniflora]
MPRLKHLHVSGCREWTQSCLPPLLETLELKGDAGDLLKEIPASNNLKSLAITVAKSVSLPRVLTQLKSLEKLTISHCDKLERLPQELQHFTSIQELNIYGCSVLGPRCQKGREDWNIISHIPNIQVDEKKIQ